ncbi:substrate-binding domain-containing protein [Sinomicrobium sp.]
MKFDKFFLLSVVLCVFTACLPEDASKSKAAEIESSYKSNKDLSSVRVGYCTPTLDAPFYVALEAAVQQSVKQYGMQYYSTDGQADISKQVVAVEDLLSKDIDVLVLNPIDPKAMVPVVETAVDRGVKVFIVDSFIDDSAPFISAVIADNQKNGELLGEWIVRKHREDLRIAIISGNQGNPVGREKRLGFIRGIADTQLHLDNRVNVEVVAQGWGKWTNNGGLKAAEDILVTYPDINVLFAENDAMAMGALKAIREMKLEDHITLLGFDGQKQAYQLLKEGNYGATAQNSPNILGRTVIETVARYLNDENVKRTTYTPSVLIDDRNVDKYYDPDALF